MDLEAVLVLKQFPLVSGIDLCGYYKNDPEIVKIVAEAVTFARASNDMAQILLHITREVYVDELEEFIQILLDGLQVAGERLKVNLKKTQSELHVVLEITSRKQI